MSDDEILAIQFMLKVQEALRDAKKLEQGLDGVASAANKAKKAVSDVGTSGVPTNASEPIAQVNAELEKVPATASKAAKGTQGFISKLFSLQNFLRTAFGTLTAVAIFKIGQALSEFFNGALKSASDFRSSMAELNLAESVLSKKGMDISMKEFDAYIAEVETKTKYLSKLDATKVVAETAGAVQEFDVTKNQMFELADAIAFIQTKNKLLGREEADAAHIINAAMDARSNFFNGMGINITEALIKEKAYAMGLVKTGQELDKAARFQAVMALLTEQTAAKQGELNKQLEDSPLGNQMALQKEWADANLRIGNAFITVRDNLVEMLAGFSPDLANSVVEFFINAANEANLFIDSLQKAADGWKQLDAAFTAATGKKMEDAPIIKFFKEFLDYINPLEDLLSILQALGAVLATLVAPIATFFVEKAAGIDTKTAAMDAGTALVDAFVSGMSTALETYVQGDDTWFKNKIKELWKGATGVDLDSLQVPDFPKDKPLQDTPTGTPPDNTAAIEQPVEDLQGALEKMNQEILEAQLKLAQDMEDAAIDLGRRLEDITIEYEQKRADAYRDYANKIADINASYASKIASINAAQAEANQQARNDELEREAKYQNQLKELKEKFLMDLEEALHERDARQVLRLIKQYQLAKTQAQREHELEQENAKRDQAARNKKFAQQRADAERERQEALAAAARDYADKLAKLKADEEAEVAAAQLKYEREKADLEKAMHDRLEIIAANLVNEFNLTQAGLDAIVALYRQYYSEVAGIYAAMQSMIAGSKNVNPTLNSGQPEPTTSGSGSTKSIPAAQGGTFLANRPTTVTFGEKGLEMASFVPVNRTGRDVNKVFSNLSGAGGGAGAGGNIGIELLLSPDLEARVVKNSLNQAANIITKVQRSKR